MKEQRILSVIYICAFIIFIVMTIFGITSFLRETVDGVEGFKSACESFGGHFWEIENVLCFARKPYCMYMCSLNGESFSMSDLGFPELFSYRRQICIRDCAYKNKQAGKVVCSC